MFTLLGSLEAQIRTNGLREFKKEAGNNIIECWFPANKLRESGTHEIHIIIEEL